ncbi:MAG TPA: DUF3592 domain-containing protein [Anaerolineales bacterium]|nr:DUF3592 domain-containing protein [Anaerolineales bacterium]
MNNSAASAKDGQAPARRFSGCVAIVVILAGCLCMAGIWYLLASDSVKILQASWHLQSNGETTTGTVVEVEQFSGVNPTSNSTFKLLVEFVMDRQAYTIESNVFYPIKGSGWIGETMPVVYDPNDPNTAQIDTFQERWLTPLLESFPF